MSSETELRLLEAATSVVFAGLCVCLIIAIDQYFKAVDKRRTKFHKTLDAWQARRLVDAAERGDGE